MTLDSAAGAMGWRAPKLSKIESATQSIKSGEVGSLLTVYGVGDSQVRTALQALAQDAGKKGWWQTYSAIVSPAYADYISLETDAETICEWSPLVIPGLLQTASYARETIAGVTTSRTPEEVVALTEVRMARQSVLSRPARPWNCGPSSMRRPSTSASPYVPRPCVSSSGDCSTCRTCPASLCS